MKSFVITFLLVITAWLAFPQNVIRFCPGPGLNDGTDEGSLYAGKDAFVYDEQYQVNYGTSTMFATNPLSYCNLTNLRAFLKFDVTSLPADVDSVFLCFMMYPYNNYCYSNCDNTFDLRYIITPWNEVTLNWSNMPAVGAPFSDTVRISFPYNGGKLRLNISNAYQEWKNGSVENDGFTIYPLDGDCNNACVSFAGYSSDFTDDTTYRPSLEIYTNQGVGVADVTKNNPVVIASPNPSQEKLTIQIVTIKPAEFELSIYDFSGKLVESCPVMATTGILNMVNINVSDYKPGVYIYQLYSAEGHATGRFVVSKP